MSYRVRSASGRRQMRCIMVGTAYIQSTPCLLDEGQGSGRVEARHDHEVVAVQQRQDGGGERARCGRAARVTRCTPSSGIRSSVANPAMASHVAGCVATMSFGRPVLPPEVGALNDGSDHRRQRIGRQRRIRLEAGGDGRPARRLRRVDADDERGVCELDDGAALDGRQPRRDRLRRGAELPDGDGRLEELDAVRQPDGDEGIARDAEIGIRAGQAVRARFHLGAGARFPLTGERGSIGVEGRQPTDPNSERRLVTHRSPRCSWAPPAAAGRARCRGWAWRVRRR